MPSSPSAEGSEKDGARKAPPAEAMSSPSGSAGPGLPSGAGQSARPPLTRGSSSSTLQGNGPLTFSSHGVSNHASHGASNHTHTNHSHAALSAAAAASSSRRPVLKVVPPFALDAGSTHESPSSTYHTPSSTGRFGQVAGAVGSPSSDSFHDPNGAPASGDTDASMGASLHSHTASASSVSSAGSAPPPNELMRRRLWFRKKTGGSATSLIVTSTELVDDVKIRILQKYPTSLQLKCDPADLVMTVPQASRIRLELQPDEDIVEVVDRYFPNGMKMNDALEVGPSVSLWGPNSASTGGGRVVTPRSGLQRTRSYSNTQSHTDQPPPISQGAFPNPSMLGGAASNFPSNYPGVVPGALTPGGSNPHQHLLNSGGTPSGQGKPLTPTQESGPPLVPLPTGSMPRSSPNEHFSQRSSVSSASSSAQSPSNVTPTNGSNSALSTPSGSTVNMHSAIDTGLHLSTSSVLLLPKELGPTKTSSSEFRSVDPHSTKLVPITARSGGESKTDSGGYFVDDHSGGGANAALTRPRSSTQPSAFSMLQQQLSPTTVGKAPVAPLIKVLIVEDNPVNLLLLETFLKRKKLRFGLASNGREALDKWKAGGYHLILMDIQLPVMTGLEVTKEIRRLEILNGIGAFPQAYKDGQQNTAAPASHEIIKKSKGGFRSPVIIVALTASSDTDDKTEALAAGCNDFLTKPVNFMWLEKKIAEWGCMQALIDYEGWKGWSDESNEKESSKSGSSGKHSRRSSSSAHQLPTTAETRTPEVTANE